MIARARRMGFLDVSDAAYRAGAQCAAVHDGGIEFVPAVEGEHGAAAGIEGGIVFEHDNGAGHGLHAGAAALQYRVACG
jgi:hypothetical protein